MFHQLYPNFETELRVGCYKGALRPEDFPVLRVEFVLAKTWHFTYTLTKQDVEQGRDPVCNSRFINNGPHAYTMPLDWNLLGGVELISLVANNVELIKCNPLETPCTVDLTINQDESTKAALSFKTHPLHNQTTWPMNLDNAGNLLPLYYKFYEANIVFGMDIVRREHITYAHELPVRDMQLYNCNVTQAQRTTLHLSQIPIESVRFADILYQNARAVSAHFCEDYMRPLERADHARDLRMRDQWPQEARDRHVELAMEMNEDSSGPSEDDEWEAESDGA